MLESPCDSLKSFFFHYTKRYSLQQNFTGRSEYSTVSALPERPWTLPLVVRHEGLILSLVTISNKCQCQVGG